MATGIIDVEMDVGIIGAGEIVAAAAGAMTCIKKMSDWPGRNAVNLLPVSN
jgi:hypothetical protein